MAKMPTLARLENLARTSKQVTMMPLLTKPIELAKHKAPSVTTVLMKQAELAKPAGILALPTNIL